MFTQFCWDDVNVRRIFIRKVDILENRQFRQKCSTIYVLVYCFLIWMYMCRSMPSYYSSSLSLWPSCLSSLSGECVTRINSFLSIQISILLLKKNFKYGTMKTPRRVGLPPNMSDWKVRKVLVSEATKRPRITS